MIFLRKPDTVGLLDVIINLQLNVKTNLWVIFPIYLLGLHIITIEFLFDHWICNNCTCVGYAVAVGHITSTTELGMLQVVIHVHVCTTTEWVTTIE